MELTAIKAKDIVVRIASAIGGRKRLLIEQKAKEMKLAVVNTTGEKKPFSPKPKKSVKSVK
ncbi:hypothetical protein HZC07_00500 [Candidatus Micrarchaeota archaeon]|nr:hypothetical protein [Candidatus Micrarchaeota archaeon]